MPGQLKSSLRQGYREEKFSRNPIFQINYMHLEAE